MTSSTCSRWRAYERDWLVFATWCAERGAQAIPAAPASVAAFLASEADRGFRPVTIGRRAAAIAAAHRAQDRPNPCDSGAVAAVMAGIRRQHGTRPLRRAAPLELDPLARLLEPIEASTLAGRRDRALLLLGFAGALRRSELVALDVEDVEFDTARGLVPATRPPPRPPGSRNARSPTSPATRTSPFSAATSAPRPRSTTSARCCESMRGTGDALSRGRTSSRRSAHALARGRQLQPRGIPAL